MTLARSPTLAIAALLIALTALLAATGHPLSAQSAATPATADTASLNALVARALATHPLYRAAAARVEAARAAVIPAGLWNDPMLMAGLQNFPIAEPGFGSMMTMKMIGVGQTIPYPGKTRLRREAAELEVAAAEARLAAVRLDVAQRVRDAYYEVAYVRQAREILERNQKLLVDFIRLAEGRYTVGVGGQQDVLRARVEAANIAAEAVALAEQARASQARLNESLDRASNAPIPTATIPTRIARAAVRDSARRIRFESTALGARAADSPLPPLQTLEELAVANSPVLREEQAMIDAQAARVKLARKDHLPDFDASLRYGQRDGYPDLVTAQVSVALPINKRRNQDLRVASARAELAAREADRHTRRNDVRLRVAELYSELERDRAQLALYVQAIIPQGQASLRAAVAGYQVGRVDFLTLLESQTTLFNYETAYHRLLTDFARKLAEMERIVGKEIL